MIKILRIITRLNIGGPAIHVISLNDGLDKKKFKSYLVTGKEGEGEGSMLGLAKERGFDVIVIPELEREISPIKDLIALFKLIKLIRKIKPYIVHTHTAKAGFLGRLAARLCGVKIIIHTFHGHVLHSYFGKIKTDFFIFLERMLSLLSTRIITISPHQMEEILSFKIGNKQRVVVIPLGLPLERFYDLSSKKGFLRNELGISDCPLVGIIARLVPIKDIGTFLLSAKLVLVDIPNAKFAIVGDGPLLDEMERYAKSLGIEKSTFFLGFRDDLDKIYADLDCLVLCSLNEGLPVCIIEAQASGIPVIATSVGGVVDLITDRKTGLLVPKKDPSALAEAIKQVLQNRELARKMADLARKEVNKYEEKRLIKDIEALYEELIAKLKY
ncbi:TPA: hypothetical protein DCX16_03250 [bacterium]|nr:hypothetical protein [bacterium]